MRLWSDWIVDQSMFGPEASLFLRGAIKGRRNICWLRLKMEQILGVSGEGKS